MNGQVGKQHDQVTQTPPSSSSPFHNKAAISLPLPLSLIRNIFLRARREENPALLVFFYFPPSLPSPRQM